MSEQGCPHGPLVEGIPCRYCLHEKAAADEKMQQIETLVTEIEKVEGERPDAAPPKEKPTIAELEAMIEDGAEPQIAPDGTVTVEHPKVHRLEDVLDEAAPPKTCSYINAGSLHCIREADHDGEHYYAAPPKEVQRMVRCEDCQVWHRPDEPCPIHEANDVTEMCWYDRDSQTLGFVANGERCYVKMEQFLASPPSDAAPNHDATYTTYPVEDAPGGPLWERLTDEDIESIATTASDAAAFVKTGTQQAYCEGFRVGLRDALNRLKGDET